MDNTISRLLGRRIHEKEQIIPSDAKEISSEEDNAEDAADKKEAKVAIEMPLIEPVVALVAPDATPHALEPLHPSQLPDPEQKTEVPAPAPETVKKTTPSPNDALAVMLGMSKKASEVSPTTATETPAAVPQSAVSGSAESLLSIPSMAAEPLTEGSLLSAAGSGMPPPPPPVDIKKTMDVYRKFGGPKT